MSEARPTKIGLVSHLHILSFLLMQGEASLQLLLPLPTALKESAHNHNFPRQAMECAITQKEDVAAMEGIVCDMHVKRDAIKSW